MYCRDWIRKGVVCLLGLGCLAFAADERPKSKDKAAKKAAVRRAQPSAKPAPAGGGVVIVKDWESGGTATRAPQAGDFPPPLTSQATIGTPTVLRTADGGIEYIGDGLMTTVTVSRSSDGGLIYGCKQAGDHGSHAHPKVSQTPKTAEEK